MPKMSLDPENTTSPSAVSAVSYPTSSRSTHAMSYPPPIPELTEAQLSWTSSPDSARETPCPVEGRTKIFSGEYRKGNLNIHLRMQHSKTPRMYDCVGCNKTYQRQDARLIHYRRNHPHLLQGPREALSEETPSLGDTSRGDMSNQRS